MNPPELPSQQEQKAIDRMIETDISFQEHERLREVPILTENVGWDD